VDVTGVLLIQLFFLRVGKDVVLFKVVLNKARDDIVERVA